MTTKTKEEVIEALSCCARGNDCKHCPYYDVPDCHAVSKYDAIYYMYKDSDYKQAVLSTAITDEERRLRKAVKAQQETINALLGL